MSLSEFTVLELLRLQRVTVADLEMIKNLFEQIDINQCGNIDKAMLAKVKLIHGYGSFSSEGHVAKHFPGIVGPQLPLGNLHSPPQFDSCSPLIHFDNEFELENDIEQPRFKEATLSPLWILSPHRSPFQSPMGLRKMSYSQYNETILKPLFEYQSHQMSGNSEYPSVPFSSPIQEFLFSFTQKDQSPPEYED
jgi:hypothetical protein